MLRHEPGMKPNSTDVSKNIAKPSNLSTVRLEDVLIPSTTLLTLVPKDGSGLCPFFCQPDGHSVAVQVRRFARDLWTCSEGPTSQIIPTPANLEFDFDNIVGRCQRHA